MNDQSSRTESEQGNRHSFISVGSPQPYDGVGRALSSAFSAVEQAELPEDMIKLLNQLK